MLAIVPSLPMKPHHSCIDQNPSRKARIPQGLKRNPGLGLIHEESKQSDLMHSLRS